MENAFDWFVNEQKSENPDNTSNEFNKLVEEYVQLFNRAVPREVIPDSISDEELSRALRKCIDSKEDTLLEDLNITLDENNLY